jgi:murein DD-endopeptidase MepM/ murein hydrolase activator NlpD
VRHFSPRLRHRPITHGLVLVIISLAVAYATVTNGGFPGRSHAFASDVTGLSLPGVSASVPQQDMSVLRAPAIPNTIQTEPQVTQKQQEAAEQYVALGATPTPAPALAEQEDGALRAASVAPPANLPPYQVHTVVEGDTLDSIASRYGIAVGYLTANNPGIHDADFLTLGQNLLIPAGNGILHEVRFGEALSDIATRYGVTVDDIAAFGPNGIENVDDITENDLVYVPNARLEIPPAGGPAAEPAPEANPPTDAPAEPAPEESAPPEDASSEDDGGGGIVAGGASSGAGLIWPVVGPISSYYGPSHPLGIDIDGFNLAGAAIGAATSGTVVFAGGNACCSYGLYVVVVSPDGIETLYGHLSSISVSEGETVAQGEQVGIIGSTGYSTGRHLHFEVIDNGTRVNPLDYLP